MASYHYSSGPLSLITSGSTSTSHVVMVNDYQTINVSWQSSASLGPSRITVWGNNANGLTASDLETASTATLGWSALTGINIIGRAVDSYTILSPGVRWMRVSVAPANHSSASVTAVTLNGQTY